MKTKKQLTLLRKLFDDAIEDHFDSLAIYDYLDEEKTEFEFSIVFKQDIKYCIDIIYNVKSKGIWDKKQVFVTDENGCNYSYEDENLIIYNKDYNPNKQTIEQKINAIIEHEENKLKERKTYAKDIELTNEQLRQQ